MASGVTELGCLNCNAAFPWFHSALLTGPAVLVSMTSREWTLVGFHAFDAAVFQKLIEQDKTDEWYIDIKPMVWSTTRMQAISQTRKAAVKKLGISLSDAAEPAPKAKSMKKRSTCVDSDAFGPEGWQQSNYVIFRLQTQENLALTIATRALIPSPHGLEMRESFQPFSPINLMGEWKIDVLKHGGNILV